MCLHANLHLAISFVRAWVGSWNSFFLLLLLYKKQHSAAPKSFVSRKGQGPSPKEGSVRKRREESKLNVRAENVTSPRRYVLRRLGKAAIYA